VTGPLALGVDIGGTKTRAAVVDERGEVLLIDEVPTAVEHLADPGLARSMTLAADMVTRAYEHGWHLECIGVGVPEYVDAVGQLHSRDVIAWERQPIEVFGALGTVTIESDVRCGAIAEAYVGAGQGATSMLYASIGTGISCALVIDNRPWRGSRGEAIALGELPVERSLDPGTAVTLEQFASGSAIARRYSRLTGESVDGARDVLGRAHSQDRRAGTVVESAAVALGAALAWAVHLTDPERVVLGGGLGASGGPWVDAIRATYVERSRPDPPPIIVAALGANSGVIGAGLAALTSDDA